MLRQTFRSRPNFIRSAGYFRNGSDLLIRLGSIFARNYSHGSRLFSHIIIIAQIPVWSIRVCTQLIYIYITSYYHNSYSLYFSISLTLLVIWLCYCFLSGHNVSVDISLKTNTAIRCTSHFFFIRHSRCGRSAYRSTFAHAKWPTYVHSSSLCY